MKIRFCVFLESVAEEYSEYKLSDCVVEWGCPFLPRSGEFLQPGVFGLMISEENKKIYQSIKFKDFFNIPEDDICWEWYDRDISVFEGLTDGGDRSTVDEVEWCVGENGLPMPCISVTIL